MLLSLTILGGVRFAIRAAHDWSPRPAHGVVTERRITLLYGAGRTGVLMARSAERNPSAGVVPVGFLDDDDRPERTIRVWTPCVRRPL